MLVVKILNALRYTNKFNKTQLNKNQHLVEEVSSIKSNNKCYKYV